jgi:lambda family phage portal protein
MGAPAIRLLDSRGRPLVNQSYEAAGQGRRATHWVALSSGPNRALSYGLATLRNRSRAAYRNNSWIWQAIERLVSNEIGVGVTLRSRARDEGFRKAANALWERSRRELDPEGLLAFGGLQAQLACTRLLAGEVFLRRRRRMPTDGLAVPLQVQVLEPEFVPLGYGRDFANGHFVRDGIELNRRGQRVAYWMYTEHPQDDGRATGFDRLVRIPARDVIHHYLPTRPGQRRGEPIAVRSLLGAHTFDSYEDAELVRKQTRAPFTGAVYREAFADQDWRYDPFRGTPVAGASDPEVDVAAGTFLALAPGEKVTLFDADDNGAGLAEYSRQVLLKIAAGLGVPYEILSGDWKQVNDRLVRSILNEFRRGIEAAQDHFIHQVCRGVWAWWMDAAMADGSLPAPNYAARRADYQVLQARPHGWRHFNPVQDVEAKIKALEARLTSRQAVIDEQPGPSVEEIDAQIAEDAERSPRQAPAQPTQPIRRI